MHLIKFFTPLILAPGIKQYIFNHDIEDFKLSIFSFLTQSRWYENETHFTFPLLFFGSLLFLFFIFCFVPESYKFKQSLSFFSRHQSALRKTKHYIYPCWRLWFWNTNMLLTIAGYVLDAVMLVAAIALAASVFVVRPSHFRAKPPPKDDKCH